ncbi:hypothetical protein ACJJTC_000869 [Scirpophaga incertulas]
MMNKAPAGSAANSKTSILGKLSSSTTKSRGSGINKSSSFFGSSGKSSKTQIYSDKTRSYFGTSSKNNNTGVSEKNCNVSEKHNYFSSNLVDRNLKSDIYTKTVGDSPKSTNLTYERATRNLVSPEKNYENSTIFNPKGSKKYDSNSSYPSFITPKTSKPSSAFGIVWLPMRKRNKKKEVVYNAHNYDNYKARSPSMYNFMPGNSSEYPSQKEKEMNLVTPEPLKMVSVAVNTGKVAAAVDVTTESTDNLNIEEKQKLIEKDNEDNKETSNENKDDKSDKNEKNDKDYHENKDTSEKSSESKYDADKETDKVDSVYLRSPPPHKASYTNPRNEEETDPKNEDCGVTCLYYILQCCDCVLM